VKEVPCNTYSNPEAVLERVQGLIVAKDTSPFVADFRFAFQTASSLHFAVDFICGGDLLWHLQKEGKFVEDRVRFYTAEIALALEHLHQSGCTRQTVTPDNILLDSAGHTILSCLGILDTWARQEETGKFTDSQHTAFNAALEYCAPELLLGEPLGRTDFWSLGVLLYEMVCGWNPFYNQDQQQMMKDIVSSRVRLLPDTLSVEGQAFVKGLLNRNPEQRLGYQRGIDEIKEHPWMADIDWEELVDKRTIPPFKPKLVSQDAVAPLTKDFDSGLEHATIPSAHKTGISSGRNTVDSGYISARMSAASRPPPFTHTPGFARSLTELERDFQSLSLAAGTALRETIVEDSEEDEGLGAEAGMYEMEM
jgi:protein-serine/threonine kinase